MKFGTMMLAAGALALAIPAGASVASADGHMVKGPKVSWKLSLWGKRRAFTEGMEYVSEQLDKKTGGKKENCTRNRQFPEQDQILGPAGERSKCRTAYNQANRRQCTAEPNPGGKVPLLHLNLQVIGGQPIIYSCEK